MKKGYEIEKSEVESTNWYQKSADQGFSMGQQSISDNLMDGIGT